MKSISAILFLVMSGFAWAYINGPTSKIEFSFTESGIVELNDSVKPIKFALISDIHLRESARSEITPEEETRSILHEFITSMNDVVKPDFIVQLGDLNDGCLSSCSNKASDEIVIERLKRAAQYTKNETSIPWFDVIGNHEYGINRNNDGVIYAAINEDWSSLEDTWYYRDIKGYRFIFLNTAFPYEGKSHMIPAEEVVWLRDVLEESSKPTFVFMHVPISDGDGSDYDRAINQEKVGELLAGDDSFVAGFFGHSHHADEWDGLRKQLDGYGNVYFHVTAPHEWMGNRSGNPWIVVTIVPGEHKFSVDTGTGVERSEITEFLYYAKERIVKFAERL